MCTRWKNLAEGKLKNITEIDINASPQCYNENHYRSLREKELQTNADTIKSVLKYLGPQIKLVKVREEPPLENVIIFGHKYSYKITDEYLDFKSIVPETCKNILEFQSPRGSGDLLFSLLETNKNLKKLVLRYMTRFTYQKRSVDSVEELVWDVKTDIIKYKSTLMVRMTNIVLQI